MVNTDKCVFEVEEYYSDDSVYICSNHGIFGDFAFLSTKDENVFSMKLFLPKDNMSVRDVFNVGIVKFEDGEIFFEEIDKNNFTYVLKHDFEFFRLIHLLSDFWASWNDAADCSKYELAKDICEKYYV